MQKVLCENGGCLAKVSGNELLLLLNGARNIAGLKKREEDFPFDDCAVVDILSSKLLLTTDQSPPVGHDPFIAGQIAALNAISDIYAMGGVPMFALASIVVGQETTTVQSEQFLAGLYDACAKESVSLVGGHTIHSVEPIIGLSVIGIPNQNGIVLTKKNCKVGDRIYLSKSIGTGLVLRGYYNQMLDISDYNSAISVMQTSNRNVLSITSDTSIHALTDVTGFGLLGHLSEMLYEAQGAIIYIDRIPMLDGVHKLPIIQMKTKYINANIGYVQAKKRFRYEIDTPEKLVLFDPQTNGSLLMIAEGKAADILKNNGFVEIGEVISTPEIILR